jgi:hypothetical protein
MTRPKHSELPTSKAIQTIWKPTSGVHNPIKHLQLLLPKIWGFRLVKPDFHRSNCEMALRQLRTRKAEGPIKPNDPTYPLRDAQKAAVAALAWYSLEAKPVPFEVVELVAHLFKLPLDPSYLDNRSELDNRSRKFYRAAKYLALNSKASNRQVAQSVGVSKDAVRKWRADPYFKRVQSACLVAHTENVSLEYFDDYVERLPNK